MAQLRHFLQVKGPLRCTRGSTASPLEYPWASWSVETITAPIGASFRPRCVRNVHIAGLLPGGQGSLVSLVKLVRHGYEKTDLYCILYEFVLMVAKSAYSLSLGALDAAEIHLKLWTWPVMWWTRGSRQLTHLSVRYHRYGRYGDVRKVPQLRHT